jgi:hypothetical protein
MTLGRLPFLGDWALLAEASPFESIQKHLNRPLTTEITPLLLVMVLGVAAVWVGLLLIDRWRQGPPREPVEDRRTLFRRLADDHGLTAEEARLLSTWSAALPEPSLLFVDPRLLETHAARHPEAAERATQIGRKLFGPDFREPVLADAGPPTVP